MTPVPENADKLTVLMLTSTMAAGGSGRFLATLLEHLDRDVFAPQLVTVFDADLEHDIPIDVPVILLSSEEPIRPCVDMDVPASVMSEPGGDAAWVQTIVDKIAHLVCRVQPDIVLCAPEWASVLAAAASDSFPASTRLICRVGAPASVAFPATGRTLLYATMLRNHFNKADRVIANSRAIASDLIDNFGIESGRVSLLHNPIDVAKVQSLAEDSVADAFFDAGLPVAVFVGRLERVKGLGNLLRAIAAVNVAVPMRCVLVGDGSQRGYLSALAKRLGIDHLVHFAGTQTNPYRFMSKAAVFVLPSLSEGMPNVLLEAMACGCPVVASDIEGGVTRELLDDGACGLIVPPGDSSAIESAILRIVGDDSLRDRLISRGLEHVRRFDLPLTMTESQELFLAVANASVVREGEQASLERNVNPTVTPHSTGDARTVLRPAAQRSAAQSGQPALGSFVARPIRRGVSLAAGAFAVLRRHGVKAVTARAMHKVRIALPLRAALHARTAGGRPREGTIQPRQSDRTQLILLVPHLDDSTIGPEAAAVLRHIDRELYDVSLVRIYPGHDTVDVPTDVVQYVVQADGGSVEVESGKLPQDIRASYSRELEWMASLAQGLAVLARQVHADVILAHGFLATNVAMLARDSLSPSTAIVSAMRSYAGDFEGSSGSARLHGALVRGYLSDADAVVVPNERIERDLISKLGVSAANVSVSPDPVEVPDQALVPAAIEVPVEWLQQPGPVFVCVEEPGFSSGMDVFLESVALARGHEDVRCAVLASAGTVRRMKDVAVRLGIDGVVRFVSEPGVARAVLARAFAYVCPCSQLGSGLPHALLAAVEEGRPVLSTRCSDAVAQFLGEGERGVLVPRGDAEALAEAMLQLVWDEEFTQRAVSRASEHLRTVSAENVVARLEGVIAACLRARQRAEGPE